MVVAEVSFEPIGTADASFSDIVTQCVGILNQRRDIKFNVEAMGTILEGERDSVLKAVSDMEDACFKAGAKRVILNLRLDERHDRPMKPAQDMEREVEDKLRRGQSGLRY